MLKFAFAIFFVLIILAMYIIFNKTPTFLAEKELASVLSERSYLNTFSKIDLRVRGVSSIQEYVNNNILPSISSYSSFEKLRLIRLSHIIDLKMYMVDKKTYFNPLKLNKIPWRFGITKGNKYEDGLSHTRNGVIMFSRRTLENYTDKQLLKTMIHEKIHVYQQVYPEDVLKFVKHKGFKIHQTKTPNDRANPDTDNFIYVDSHNNEYRASYIPNAKSITDVKYKSGYTQTYEHPYESMAIELEKI